MQSTKFQKKRSIPWTNISLLFCIFLLVGLYFYMKSNRVDYLDTTYGFSFKTLDSWSPVEPVGESYVAFATTKDGQLGSYSEIRIIPHQGVPLTDLESVLKESCDQTASNLSATNSEFTEVSWNDVSGYRCSVTAIDPESGMEITSQTDNLYNKDGGEYDFVLTVAWPTNDQEETEKVEVLRQGFNIF